jgi:hypothetical protein
MTYTFENWLLVILLGFLILYFFTLPDERKFKRIDRDQKAKKGPVPCSHCGGNGWEP